MSVAQWMLQLLCSLYVGLGFKIRFPSNPPNTVLLATFAPLSYSPVEKVSSFEVFVAKLLADYASTL